MHLRPELHALRSDDTPQRVAQTEVFRARNAWQARPEVVDLVAELAAFSGSHAMAECPALAALFDEESPAAQQLVDSFVFATCEALARQPLGQVALRHFTDGVVSTLRIADAGRASLLLVALDGEALGPVPEPVSISFSAIESWERVMAGSAEAELIEARPAGENRVRFNRRRVDLSPGRIVAREGNRQTLALRRIEGRLVSLKLQRRQLNPAPTREYDFATGTLIHQAASDLRESRQELMVALLGRMERRDAAPLLGALSREAKSPSLRWEALRECLGLDALTGMTALKAIAAAPDDPLAAPAAAMRAQLITAHPQLAGI
ncbi:MAG: hypothetical protein KGL44_10115 [Sphingomonadales bacterium]|nr:hypothetical protein [Sphingomonadales bacterium]